MGECLAASAPRVSDWARRSPPSLFPSLLPGPLPRSLPAHSRGDVPCRGCRGRCFFHTLVGSCAPRSVTGELAARRRRPPARTRARLRGFRLLLPATGRRGSPGHTVGRRKKRRRTEEETRHGGKGRGAGGLPPSAPPASAQGKREPSPAPGRGELAAVPAPARLPGHARVGWEGGLQGVCRAEGMGAAIVALPACGPGWGAAAGAGLVVLLGTEPGVGGAAGGVFWLKRRDWDAVGAADGFRHIEAWVAGVRHPSLPTRTPAALSLPAPLALHVAAVLCKPELERKKQNSGSFAVSPNPFSGCD